MSAHRLALVLLAVLGPAAVAQHAAPLAGARRLSATLPSQLASDLATRRIPLHTMATDPGAEPYGVWAAGPNYKASFHDGFTFYPALGPAYPRNLPLRWTTESIAVGATFVTLPASRPAPRYTDWRCEFALGEVTEAYDVRQDGVEQTFVLARPLPGRGDLTITGRIATELRAPVVAEAHQALVFTDGTGSPIVRYGAATAIDAAGRRGAATTSCDGSAVEITVPGAWLADAVYPVIVDPLTNAEVVTGALRTLYALDSAHDAESLEVMLVMSYESSATDIDTTAWLTRNDFTGEVQVFADLQTHSTRFSQCCFVGGSDCWVIAIGRESGALTGGIGIYVHPKANHTMNVGRTIAVARPGGSSDWQPSIGGSFHPTNGNRACLVWQRTSSETLARVWCAVFDPATAASPIPTSGQFVIPNRFLFAEQAWPSVNRCSHTGDWIVVHSEYDVPVSNDAWDVWATVVLANSSVAQQLALGDGRNVHKILPKIEGNDGRYFYSYTEKPVDGRATSIHGNAIRAEQFDWTGTVSRRSGTVLLDTATSLSLTTGQFSRAIAYDRSTGSHALVGYQTTLGVVSLMRIGINAQLVEHIALFGAGYYSPTVVYNPNILSFAVSYVVFRANLHNVEGRYFDYQSAGCQSIGPSCFGTLACSNGSLPVSRAVPHRGSSLFALDLRSTGANQLHVPILGVGQTDLPLNGNCRLFVNPVLPIVVLPGVRSTATGTLRYPLAIPESLLGDAYLQFLRVVGTQLESSPAMKLMIR